MCSVIHERVAAVKTADAIKKIPLTSVQIKHKGNTYIHL